MPPKDDKMTNVSTDVTVAVVALLVIFAFLGAWLGSILDWYTALLEWFYSGDWGFIYKVVVIMAAILNVLLIAFLVFILRRVARLNRIFPLQKPKTTAIVPIEDEVGTAWKDVQELSQSGSPADWNMAIIRADNLLNEALLRLGYEGDTVADKLKITDPTRLKSIDEVWSAHRLRNAIVHGPLQEYTKETITYAISVYETALKELGALKESK